MTTVQEAVATALSRTNWNLDSAQHTPIAPLEKTPNVSHEIFLWLI